ncbi:MAG: hypothetical protein ACSLE1_00115 [Sphingobium sp.]
MDGKLPENVDTEVEEDAGTEEEVPIDIELPLEPGDADGQPI